MLCSVTISGPTRLMPSSCCWRSRTRSRWAGLPLPPGATLSESFVPARRLREAYEPDVVVATDTRPRFDQVEPWLPGPLRDFLDAGWQESVRDLEAADLAISPKLPGSMFRFDLAGEFASAGRVAATARLAEIRSLIA